LVVADIDWACAPRAWAQPAARGRRPVTGRVASGPGAGLHLRDYNAWIG
jgi:hypothetical protein